MKIHIDDINAEGSVQINQQDRESHSSNLYEVIVQTILEGSNNLENRIFLMGKNEI